MSDKKKLFYFSIFIVSTCLALIANHMASHVSIIFVYIFPFICVLVFSSGVLLCEILFCSGIKRWSRILYFVIFLLVGFVFTGVCLRFIRNFNVLKGNKSTAQYVITKFGSELIAIVNQNGYFPDSNNWCDVLLKNNDNLARYHFILSSRPEVSCSYGFNINLSGVPISELSSNTVLLIEADGQWNLCGGRELISTNRYKDKYWPPRDRYAFIYLIDGTLVKYRLRDKAVSVRPKGSESFTKYIKPDAPCYIDIQWEK